MYVSLDLYYRALDIVRAIGISPDNTESGW